MKLAIGSVNNGFLVFLNMNAHENLLLDTQRRVLRQVKCGVIFFNFTGTKKRKEKNNSFAVVSKGLGKPLVMRNANHTQPFR